MNTQSSDPIDRGLATLLEWLERTVSSGVVTRYDRVWIRRWITQHPHLARTEPIRTVLTLATDIVADGCLRAADRFAVTFLKAAIAKGTDRITMTSTISGFVALRQKQTE